MITRGLFGAVLASPVLGQLHHFYSGVFSGSSLYGFEFNEKSEALSIFYNGSLDVSSSKWIATDVCCSSPFPTHNTEVLTVIIEKPEESLRRGWKRLPELFNRH